MCIICDQDPGSHSFEFYGKTNEGIYMYYTCPAKATRYWDTKGILSHYKEVLEQNNNNKWIWVFDSDGFDLKHSLEIETAIGIIKILSQYDDSLCEIQIVNANLLIKTFYTLIYSFLSTNIINKIRWINAV
jgi:hypothetical protein